MQKIITPGIFLAAALAAGACTDPDDQEVEGDEPDVAACCAPDRPRGSDLLYDSFDLGREARTRFDLLVALRRPK
ncbi:MAG: hypothetical protein HS111_19730 [Kofleriaceae bacterium]|nr:hypothetical protein [Kofleriaceae bacterium]MCL4225170.1 hypothetical protein [Myxococcales bacterium]